MHFVDLRQCWWRMLKTKCVGDKFEILMTVSSVFVINILYLLTLASDTNIQRCHQYRNSVINIEVQSVVCWKTHRFNFDKAYTNFPVCVGFSKALFGFAMNRIQWFSLPTSYWLHWWNSSKWVNEIWNGNFSFGSFQKDQWVPPNRFSLFGVMKSTKIHKSARYS